MRVNSVEVHVWLAGLLSAELPLVAGVPCKHNIA
jgi:hypothetical protein